MKKLLTALVIIVSLATTGAVCAQDRLKGFRAFQSGDYATALKEWTVLAKQGHAEAQSALGVMYRKGHGVAQDYKETVKWFRRSAEQGHAEAQSDLGLMFAGGRGVIQDSVYAHMWINIAASNGYALAMKNRDILEKMMTAAEISKAQERARECVAKKFKGC